MSLSNDDRQAGYPLGERLASDTNRQGTNHFGAIDPGFSKTTPVYIGELDTEEQCIRIVYSARYDNAVPG